MNIQNERNLWKTYGDKGKLLFTQVPNVLMNGLISGHFKGVQGKIILYVCRMSYGFKREETNYLGPADFKDVMGIQKSHFSTNIKTMIKEGILFRGKEGGGKYKYAVNLLAYGCKMKCYKLVDAGYKLGDEEYTFDEKGYAFRNRDNPTGAQIIYKSGGFEGKEKLYIKEDIKKERKIERKNNTASGSGFVGATTTEAVRAVNKTIPQMLIEREQQCESLLVDFERELMKCSASLAVQVMIKHMPILVEAGFTSGEIGIRFCDVCKLKKKNIKGEVFNIQDWNTALAAYQEEIRNHKG